MSIWTRPLTTPDTDEKIGRLSGRIGRLAVLGATLAALAFWTYVVRGIHDYCYRVGAWSDGASRRGPDDWTPYVVLWFVPVLLVLLLALMVRASMAKKEPR